MSEQTTAVRERRRSTAQLRTVDPEKYATLAQFADKLKPAEREIVGREVEITRLMAGMQRPELPNVLLLAAAGTGKLLPLDTPIPTPTGWTTMGELQLGDQILGRDGRPGNVVFESEIEEEPELYRITTSDERSQIACVDHQWLVSDLNGREQAHPKRLEETKARRAKSAARREALVRLAEASSEEYVVVEDILAAIVDVPDITWTSINGLQTYLKRAGAPSRVVVKEQVQEWKGTTRRTTVMRREFRLRNALEALADQKHRRTSYGMDDEYVERVMTTGEMLMEGVEAADGRRRFAIRIAKALELPEADLPVDPYVLGAWLGDGNSKDGRFTQAVEDQPHLFEQLELNGYAPHRLMDEKSIGTRGLKARLREVGVLLNKHIPMDYLRASKQQRLALLQGLMDTDGTVDERGTCELTLSDERLASDALELIRSLGMKCNSKGGDSGYKLEDGSYVECKTRFRMVFTTSELVFRMQRKAERLPAETRRTADWVYVTSIERVESQPGKCIQVDTLDSMYLCGPGLLPTHNTALVQAAMMHDAERLYLEVDPARMLAAVDVPEKLGGLLKQLFDDAEQFVADTGVELVLFIDEFHQIIQATPSAVESLKPVLAASGTRGIRVIAATTNEEFHQHISSNQPLVERLQRINVPEPDKSTTIAILRGMSDRYGVADQFHDDRVFEAIYDYTNRYNPSGSQPRKSILLLDGMVGWHRQTKRPINKALLADVLQESTGVNVAFRIDAGKVQEQLDGKVFSQQMATRTLADRLHVCVADLHDKTKPSSSFLFAGSTGVGKSLADGTLVPVIDEDALPGEKPIRWLRIEDVEPGDRVVALSGRPTPVLGSFPQGERRIYRMKLRDGRTLDVDGQHLHRVSDALTGGTRTITTEHMLEAGLVVGLGERLGEDRFRLPVGGAAQWSELDLPVVPYAAGLVLGSMVQAIGGGRGSLAIHPDLPEGLLAHIAEEVSEHVEQSLLEPRHFIASKPGLTPLYAAFGVLSKQALLDRYQEGSVQQRKALLRGFADAAEHTGAEWGLVRQLFFSLGAEGGLVVGEAGREAGLVQDARIRSIEELDGLRTATCIMVEDEEHLFQAGQFVVTHNTELTKQMTRLLFGDAQRHFIRFDMSEYANTDSLDTFRSQLTRQVWNMGHSVILFDEVEKANSVITKVLLQVLDDGRLSDDNGRQVSFLNCYIVLTTNAGSEIFSTIAQYEVDDDGSGEKLEDYMKQIKRSIVTTSATNGEGPKFPPELLGRIDAVIPFQPLSLETQRKVVKSKLKALVQEVRTRHGVTLKVDTDVLTYLVDDNADTDSNAGGARAAVSKMTEKVTTEIARFINDHPGEKNLRVDIVGTMASQAKDLRKGSAQVVVSAIR